jgi:hypothetical protein
MKRTNVTPIILFSLLAAGCRPTVSATSEDLNVEHIAAKIAIVVDGTASFADRLPEAQKIVASFIAQNAVMGEAEVYLYRLDRQPKLVSSIKASEFMTRSQSELVRSIGDATLTTGTDLVLALEMSVEKLKRSSESVADRLFLLVFTDGHIDPAKDNGVAREFRSLDAFDWGMTKGITTRFFFLDYEPYKALTQATGQQGLDLHCFEDGETVTVKDLRQMVDGQ